MKIIADSSSTRTEWALVDGTDIVAEASTEGLNPFFQSRREISHCVRLQLPEAFFKRRWDKVYFYGAGCSTEERKDTVKASLVAQFKTPIEVESDLLGAARGMFINSAGLACILGTGSNSCLYDGYGIVQNVKPLGFILGDEGSGSALGKLFLSDCLKNLAPRQLQDEFYAQFNVTPDEIMDSVYVMSLSNKTLSKYSFFLAAHLDNDYIHTLVHDEIMRFFKRNISQYDYVNYPLCFVGAVACTYSDILKEVASEFGASIKKIVPRSMPGLIEFHGKE